MSKFRFLSVFILLFFTISAFSQEAPNVLPMSLQECIDYALKNNTMAKNAALENRISKARVGEILADGLPQINGSAEIMYNYLIPTQFIPVDENFPFGDVPPGADVIPLRFSVDYLANASVTLEQMVFDGSYFVGLKAARTYTDLARKDQIKTEIDVIENVTKAYYSVLINMERKELVETNYRRLDSLLIETQAMYENGFAEKIDVNRIKVEFNNIMVDKKRVEQGYAVSYVLLKYQMGMPVQEVVVLTDQLRDIELELLDYEKETFSYDQRIEYSQLMTNYDLAKLDVKNFEVMYIPKLSVFGNIGANTGAIEFADLFNFGDRWFGLGGVGVRLNVPIFDGLRKSRQIQQRKIQVEQIENAFDEMRNRIEMEIIQSKADLESNLMSLELQKENMELAAEVYNITKIKYQEGVGSNLEVVDADSAYKTAQNNYYNALFDVLITRVDIDKAYGRLKK